MRNYLNKAVTYFKASWKELKKVTWPTKNETVNYTLLVVSISLIIATFLGIIDWLFSLILEKLVK